MAQGPVRGQAAIPAAGDEGCARQGSGMTIETEDGLSAAGAPGREPRRSGGRFHGWSLRHGMAVLLGAFSVFWGASLFLFHLPPTGLTALYFPNEKREGYPSFMLQTPHAQLDEVIGAIAQSDGPVPEHVGIAWSGWIRIEADGVYRFSTLSDDGSAIVIDDRVVVDNDGSGASGERWGEVSLSRGLHRFVVTYFNATGDGYLKVRWDGAQGVAGPIKTRFLLPSRFSPALDALPRDPRILYWLYPALWCLLFVGIQKSGQRRTVAKKALAVLGLSLLSLLLMRVRYVCLPAEQMQALLLYSYCFFLSLPCVYIVCKLLFPDAVRVFLVTYYALLALFPYRLLFPGGTDLCRIFSYPPASLRLGLERYWVLVLYAVLSLAVVAAWRRLRARPLPGAGSRMDLAVCVLCLAAVTLQIAPRLDENSPRMVRNGVHDGSKACGYESSTTDFYGHCVMCDATQHTATNGMVKGVRSEQYRRLVINRRLLGGYAYSLVEPFVHPYYAAILVNGLFLYLLAMAGYALARHLALHRTIAVVFPLLLTANHLYLFEAVDTSFYVQKDAFALLVLAAAYILGIWDQRTPVRNKALFGAVLACSSLVYDPFLLVGFIFLWGLYLAARQAGGDKRGALATLSHAAGYACIPILSQTGLENLLYHFHLEGNLDNTFVRNILFRKMPALPHYLLQHTDEFIARCNEELFRVFFENPAAVEFFSIMAVFGLYCFAVLVPRYVRREQLAGLYAIYGACIMIPLAAALLAYLPPVSRYADVYTSFIRSTVYYPVIVLSQSIGIHHLAERVGSRVFPAVNGAYLAYGLAACVWLASFYQIVSK